MFAPLSVAVVVTALLLAAWCGIAAVRDQPVKDWHYAGMAVVLLLTLVQAGVAAVRLAGGARPDGGGTGLFLAYLLAVVLCLPVVAIVALGERSRWGSATVAGGAVVLAALQVRLADVWAGGAGG